MRCLKRLAMMGGPNPKFMDRKAPLRMIWAEVVPPTAGWCGKAHEIARSLWWADKRLTELAGILAQGARKPLSLAS